MHILYFIYAVLTTYLVLHYIESVLTVTLILVTLHLQLHCVPRGHNKSRRRELHLAPPRRGLSLTTVHYSAYATAGARLQPFRV